MSSSPLALNPPAASTPGRLPAQAWYAGLAALFIAVAWAPTWIEMWTRWFPAWRQTAEPIWFRLTGGSSYYTHGPLVPFVSLAFALRAYSRRGLPADPTRSSAAFGALLLGLSMLLHLLSVYADVTFVSGFALVGLLLGLLLIAGGRPLARAYLAPVLLLVFMVPLPMHWIASLNFNLKMHAGHAAGWLAGEVFLVPTILDGSYLLLPPGPTDEPKRLLLESTCGGLRSLISLTWLGALFAAASRARRPWPIAFVALALPVAVAGNIVRITALILVAHGFSCAAAGPAGWFHNVSGLLVFLLAASVFFGLESLLGRWAPDEPVSVPSNLPEAHPALPAAIRFLLFVLAGLSLLASRTPTGVNHGRIARQAMPAVMVLNGAELTGHDRTLDPRTLAILETDDYIARRYTDPSADICVDVLVVFSPNNRKGVHPPEVCLEGGGQHVVAREDLQAGGIPIRALLTQRGSQKQYHLYTYKCSDHYTTSFLSHQASVLLHGLTRRNASGALVRIDIPVRGHGTAQARATARAAAEWLLPRLTEELP